ncbi:hypothetical protein PR003_g15667 [Phytophthora rubi]|uniref:Uncharacterized protein n=1 Tax=Phytophthora rubi TaxID=129364 RepID=A0A6A4ESS1_9STRA|nr:hypothetical protein PR003_g15667 [Phytophthora rubi]
MNCVAAVVTLQVDKKLSKPEDYPAWRLRVLTGLNVSTMAQLVIGQESFDDNWSYSMKQCWLSRSRKANGLLVSAISDEVLLRYQDVVNLADPIVLWRILKEDFGQGRGVNPVLIWERLYGRMLRPDEPVREYIADLLKMQRELAENNDPISDSRLAKITLTKAHIVYPVIAGEVTEKLRRDPGYKYTVRDARGRLENAEIQRAQRDPVSGGATSSRGLSTQAQANAVQQHRNNGKGPRRSSSRQRGGKYGVNKSSGSSTSSLPWSAERMAKKKKNSKCNASGEKGHWRGDPECMQGKRQTLRGTGDQAVQPFGGAVLRQQAPHRSQDRVVECMTSRADDEVGSNEPCVASSQSLTMADVLAVLGPQAAKQMQKKLQARSSASVMPARALSPPYSPTSPSTQYSPTTPASPGFEVNAAAVQRDQRVPALQADEMEWLLDSGSQVNMCGDLTCFSYIERGSS